MEFFESPDVAGCGVTVGAALLRFHLWWKGRDDTVVRWLDLSPYTLQQDQSVPVSVWVSSGRSGFFPQLEDMQIRSAAYSKLPIGVNVGVSGCWR